MVLMVLVSDVMLCDWLVMVFSTGLTRPVSELTADVSAFTQLSIHRGQAVLQTGELLRLRIQFTLGRRHPGGQPGDSALLGLLTDRRIRDGQIAAEFRQLLRPGGDSPFSSGDAGIHLRNGPGISCDILFIHNIEDMEIIEIHCPALRKVVSWKLAVVVFVAFQSNVTSCQPELNGP